MGRRMTLRACLVLPQLPLRPLPGFWINDRRHWDSNPLARRPSGPALRIPRDPVVAPASAIRLVCFPRLGPIVTDLPCPFWRKANNFRGLFVFLLYDVATINMAYIEN